MLQSPYRTLPCPSITKGDMLRSDIYNQLAILYLQNQDIKSLSPAELYDKYRKVLDEITQEAKKYKTGTAVLK